MSNIVSMLLYLKKMVLLRVRARNGDVLTGTWTTRVTDNGAL